MSHSLENKNFEFKIKTKTKFGDGQAVKLGEYLKDLKLQNIGVVIDPGVAQNKYVKDILDSIHAENFSKVKVWEYNLNSEPDYDSLDKVKQEFLGEDSKPLVDCFVGIGGGSVIDFAKGLATVVVNPGKAINYRGFPTELIVPLPVITVPTTAGTASEVTFNAVFIDLENKKKLGINTTHNFPILAILDPRILLGCPRKVALSSGMDALTHSLESYVACQANSLTRNFSKEAFKLIFNNLPKVLSNSDDIDSWANMQMGAYLAGISLMNSGSGPAGALSYILGTKFKVSHGIAGAIFLPHIVEFNYKRGYDYSELNNSIPATSKNFSEKFFDFCKESGVPSSLKEFGVTEENIGLLLEETKNLEKAFAQNAVPFSVEDGNILLKKLIN